MTESTKTSSERDDLESNSEREGIKEPSYVQKWLIFYSIWNVFFGIIMIFTAFLLDAYGLPSRLTRFVGIAYIMAAALCFFAKMTKLRILFVILIIFAISSAFLTLLTFGGFSYSLVFDKKRNNLANNNFALALFDAFLHILNFLVYLFSIYVFFICCRFETAQALLEKKIEDDRHKGCAEHSRSIETTSPATAISENI